jgi:hypothetical protein
MAVHTEDGDYECQYGAFVYPMSFEEGDVSSLDKK